MYENLDCYLLFFVKKHDKSKGGLNICYINSYFLRYLIDFQRFYYAKIMYFSMYFVHIKYIFFPKTTYFDVIMNVNVFGGTLKK